MKNCNAFKKQVIKVPNLIVIYFKGKHEGTQQPTDCAVNIHFSAYLSDFIIYLVSLLSWLIKMQLKISNFFVQYTLTVEKFQFLHPWSHIHIRSSIDINTHAK